MTGSLEQELIAINRRRIEALVLTGWAIDQRPDDCYVLANRMLAGISGLEPHMLVVEIDRMTRQHMIRGMFSTSQISKLVGQDITDPEYAAHTLAEVYHAIDGDLRRKDRRRAVLEALQTVQ